MLTFLIDENLGLNPAESPWSEIFPALNIETVCTTDLVELDRSVEAHEPDIAFMPIADFHGVLRSGDDFYRGFALVTSKFTGTTNLPSVLVVRKDDPATSLDDLAGAAFAYINRSCTSSYFSPAILLHQVGHSLNEYFDLRPTTPWQGQIDAVIAGDTRVTMVPEDVWKTTTSNTETTKIIGRYDKATGALIVVRAGLDEQVLKTLREALFAWQMKPDAVYGGFTSFRDADVAEFFEDLSALPTTF